MPTGDIRSQTFEAHIDLPAAARNSWTIGQLVSVAVPIRPRASTIAVEIGDSAGDLVAVTGPIDPGDRVAIRGAENLQEGADVKIMESRTSASAASVDG